MSRILSKRYPFKRLAVYPGMRPKDEAIWDEFMMRHPDAFEHVYYNEPIGDPVPPGQDYGEYRAAGMDDVSKWRVDVLAYASGTYYVIEIKPNAGAGAIGQALCYSAFLRIGALKFYAVQPAVLTDDIAPITQQAASLLNVVMMVP